MRLVSRYSRLMQHVARGSSVDLARLARRLYSILQPELRQRARIVGPVLAHLDPEIRDAGAGRARGVEFFARLLADALEARSLGADDDGFLPARSTQITAWTIELLVLLF
mgnify:CR=1 FL=1